MKAYSSPYIFSFPAHLLPFLAGKMEGKATRLQALCWLFQKQKNLLDIDFHGGSKVPFFITVNGLAQQWKWNKRTVSRFLEILHQSGVISIERVRGGFYVRVLGISETTSGSSAATVNTEAADSSSEDALEQQKETPDTPAALPQ